MRLPRPARGWPSARAASSSFPDRDGFYAFDLDVTDRAEQRALRRARRRRPRRHRHPGQQRWPRPRARTVLGLDRRGRGDGDRDERARRAAHDAPLPAAHPRRRPHRQPRARSRVASRTRTPPSTSRRSTPFADSRYALREDLLGRPIHLTTVDPGLVETNFSKVRFRGDEDQAKKVYEGVDALTPDDIAECVLFAVTRPAHVNIDELVVKALAQSTAFEIVERPVVWRSRSSKDRTSASATRTATSRSRRAGCTRSTRVSSRTSS